MSKYIRNGVLANASPRSHPTFIKYTTSDVRRTMTIEPNSSLLVKRISNWDVIDKFQISFDIDFDGNKVLVNYPPGSKPIAPSSYRMHGHPGGCGGHWCLGAIERLQ
jgi:hypothetical protein